MEDAVEVAAGYFMKVQGVPDDVAAELRASLMKGIEAGDPESRENCTFFVLAGAELAKGTDAEEPVARAAAAYARMIRLDKVSASVETLEKVARILGNRTPGVLGDRIAARAIRTATEDFGKD